MSTNNVTLKDVRIATKVVTYGSIKEDTTTIPLLGEKYTIKVSSSEATTALPAGVYSKTGDGTTSISALPWDNDSPTINAAVNNLGELTTALESKLAKKADNYSISFNINGAADGTHGIKFLSMDYSSIVYGSTETPAVYAKLKLLGSHTNGQSYKHAGQLHICFTFNKEDNKVNVEGTTIREYADLTPSNSGKYANKHYGDIFYIHDATNYKVDVYVIMGQYSKLHMTPIDIIEGNSSLITQFTSYSLTSKYSGEISADNWIPLATVPMDEFSEFSSIINQAITAAQSKANDAASAAQTAQEKATEASTLASAANDDATTALSKATTAETAFNVIKKGTLTVGKCTFKYDNTYNCLKISFTN